ncbi:MAG: hypothetical protein EBR82_12695 [Caulobacteraceae bacterium]|nr:hypothetical protein [Caulobacteraceae bacterium]
MTAKTIKAVLVMAAFCVASPAPAQSVPESIHSEAEGPVELCGLAASDVAGLKAAAKASPRLVETPIGSARFELFASDDQMDQLIFTTAGEAAYPAATCRHMYEDNGALRMNRKMRCEAGRAECDAMFLEFQALDAQMTRSIQGRD